MSCRASGGSAQLASEAAAFFRATLAPAPALALANLIASGKQLDSLRSRIHTATLHRHAHAPARDGELTRLQRATDGSSLLIDCVLAITVYSSASASSLTCSC